MTETAYLTEPQAWRAIPELLIGSGSGVWFLCIGCDHLMYCGEITRAMHGAMYRRVQDHMRAEGTSWVAFPNEEGRHGGIDVRILACYFLALESESRR